MLRGIVETFLESLTEREFDAPLLALLAAQGFSDIHFIHGSFEFGKDVIAKRVDADTGELRQYAIQSKAGDIGQASWREIRPQLEESEYNTRAHPAYDASLPRVAVLLTTGRLKGAAAVDSQEFQASVKARGLASFEVWERTTLTGWLAEDPDTGLLGRPSAATLLSVVSDIENHAVTEPVLEHFTREWIPTGGDISARSVIEAAVLVNALRRTERLDLAALCALHLFRAASGGTLDPGINSRISDAARRLVLGIAAEILDEVEPLLANPLELLRATAHPLAIAIYPVICCRTAEIIALLAIATDDSKIAARARSAVEALAARHPGTLRPISDQFAVSALPVVIVLNSISPIMARAYVRSLADWLLDRYDPQKAGLGLAALDETEAVAIARLLGGALDVVDIDRRLSSYLAAVILDLCVLLGAGELYDVFLDNLNALRVVATMEAADETTANWRRGGQGVHMHPVVTYKPWGADLPSHHGWAVATSSRDALLLTASCRSRHYPEQIRASLADQSMRT